MKGPPARPKALNGLRIHPKSPDASLEKLKALAGIVVLNAPVVSTRVLSNEDDGETCDEAGSHAGD